MDLYPLGGSEGSPWWGVAGGHAAQRGGGDALDFLAAGGEVPPHGAAAGLGQPDINTPTKKFTFQIITKDNRTHSLETYLYPEQCDSAIWDNTTVGYCGTQRVLFRIKPLPRGTGASTALSPVRISTSFEHPRGSQYDRKRLGGWGWEIVQPDPQADQNASDSILYTFFMVYSMTCAIHIS